MLTINIELTCKECDSILEVEERGNSYKVEPCRWCMEKVKFASHATGWEEARKLC